MAGDKKSVIIIKKVKKGHGGHHGGSWKVAYADFVTAMMAFFMVMWILGMDDSTKAAIEGYFSNPIGYKKGYSTGSSPISTGSSPGTVQTPNPLRLITRSFEEQQFRQIAERIETRVQHSAGLKEVAAQIEVVVTDKGLRVELMEGDQGETFFAFGSADLKPAAASALAAIALELKDTGTPLVIEGHTDSAPFGRKGYTNWELSSDRANAARRALETAGLGPYRISEVRGYADRDLRNQDDPLDRSNRRISILLPFASSQPTLPGTEATPKPGAV